MEDSGAKEGRFKAIAGDVLRAVAIDLTGRVIAGVGIFFVGALAFLVLKGGSVPAWLLVVSTALVCAIGIAMRQQVASALSEAKGDNGVLQAELERHGEYSRHLENSLDALQRIISGDVDAELPYYVEQGVLTPARDILSEKPAENVRLSVLLPRADDSERWTMAWAAGHSMVGKLKYDERIADTLARHAFESGEPQYWPDTEGQTEFRQNPDASAPTRALVSIPIRHGDQILGVFNAVAAETGAFDEAEQRFLASLAGVAAVAVGVWHEHAPGDGNDRRPE